MSLPASDNFTRADSLDLGTNWDPCSGETHAAGLEIFTNRAWPPDSAADCSETWNADVFPNDQYSEITFVATAADGAGAGMGCTCRAATGATVTYYRAVGNASGYELGKKIAGAFTSLSSGTGTTFTAGDKLTMEWQGTTWRLKKNGVQFATGTDSSISSGRAGIAHSSTSTGTVGATLWGAGAISASSGNLAIRRSGIQPYGTSNVRIY